MSKANLNKQNPRPVDEKSKTDQTDVKAAAAAKPVMTDIEYAFYNRYGKRLRDAMTPAEARLIEAEQQQGETK